MDMTYQWCIMTILIKLLVLTFNSLGMLISELIKKLQEIQKERNCELDAINSLGDEIVAVKWLAFSSSVVFMTDEDL